MTFPIQSVVRGAQVLLLLTCLTSFPSPARSQEESRIAVAVMPIRPAKGTDPSFAQLATTEVRAMLTRATWLTLVETDRIDRILSEVAKSHTLDYDRDQALETGRQVKADWICTGTVRVFIFPETVENNKQYWSASAVITIEATSLKEGGDTQVSDPIRQDMVGFEPDAAKRLVPDCTRTAGQIAGDQVSKWIVPLGSVVESDGKRCLIDLGSAHGIQTKLKFALTPKERPSPPSKVKPVMVTIDQVGPETSGAKVPGRVEIHVGDVARLMPELRGGAGTGLGSLFRQFGSVAQPPPTAPAASGDNAQSPYAGPPIAVGTAPSTRSREGGDVGANDAPWLEEIPYQKSEEEDLNVAGPGAIGFTPQGEMLVTDGPSGKVMVYGPDGVMRREQEFTDAEGGPPRLIFGLSVDSRGVAYVTEHSGCRIFRMDGNGGSLFAACPGDQSKCQQTPGITVGRDGSLYVGDWCGRVMKVSSNGSVVATWDSIPGDIRRGYMNINALATGPDGSILVVDDMGNRLIRLSPDGSILGVTSLKAASGQDRATYDALAVDREGYAWILPQFARNLIVVAPDGRFVPLTKRVLPGKMEVAAIGIDLQGNLCLYDSNSLHYRKFKVEHSQLPFDGN
jgi:sugar lactone lactonase YvrE